LVFKFTKSRRNFYTQIERRSFHAAKTHTGSNSTPPRASVAGPLQSEKLEKAAQKEVAAQVFSASATGQMAQLKQTDRLLQLFR
jgi:hypothetical protein